MSILQKTHAQLENGWRRLQSQWRTSHGLWLDVVRDQFEGEIWQDFERTVPAVLGELKRLDHIIDQARREVP